ncbi:MAG: hypothetical protein LBT78_00360 [Tannerella sp.]|jgi:hypothetical protein|nr:hypothetical protein [Tannerella sp.]
MNTIQPPAVADTTIPGIEFDENGKPAGISAEEWAHKLGHLLVEQFGESVRSPLNESLAGHGMYPLR